MRIIGWIDTHPWTVAWIALSLWAQVLLLAVKA